MATITRVQHVQYDETVLLAVQGTGTDTFMLSNMPNTHTLRSDFGVVLSGRIRVTKSSRSDGYFFLALDGQQDRRRTFFKADAKVRIDGHTATVEQYYNLLTRMEVLGITV